MLLRPSDEPRRPTAGGCGMAAARRSSKVSGVHGPGGCLRRPAGCGASARRGLARGGDRAAGRDPRLPAAGLAGGPVVGRYGCRLWPRGRARAAARDPRAHGAARRAAPGSAAHGGGAEPRDRDLALARPAGRGPRSPGEAMRCGRTSLPSIASCRAWWRGCEPSSSGAGRRRARWPTSRASAAARSWIRRCGRGCGRSARCCWPCCATAMRRARRWPGSATGWSSESNSLRRASRCCMRRSSGCATRARACASSAAARCRAGRAGCRAAAPGARRRGSGAAPCW